MSNCRPFIICFVFILGKFPALFGQSLSPITPLGLSAAVSSSISSHRRTQRTYTAKPTPQLWYTVTHQNHLLNTHCNAHLSGTKCPHCTFTENFKFFSPAVVPGAATVIIMVCVGFLVVMVILGVFRIRSIHRRGEGARGADKESSNQWDDSALTIIVNPMEVSATTSVL